MTDYSKARRAMIDSQLRTSGVNDPRVLAAMLQIAREDLVPEARAGQAYADRAVPLGNGRALPAPLFHGRMLQEADIPPWQRHQLRVARRARDQAIVALWHPACGWWLRAKPSG